MTGPDAAADVRERYARFAAEEAGDRSALYAEWAAGVAGDAEVCALLARIAPNRRQPPLVFAVTRLLGAAEDGYPTWRTWLVAHSDAVVAECAVRSIQTNEPLRCAALLPALSLVDGPIALLEVGASAGLCLFPDRYSYRYGCDDGTTIAVDPPHGPSPVVLESRLRGPARPRLALPDVVWRAGIDLAPLDARSASDRAWLTGLVWPGETGRAERVVAALRIAAADPPELVAGDAAEILDHVASTAPDGATLVVTTPGVLAHVPRAARERIVAAARAAGRWITLDAAGLHTGVDGRWTAPHVAEDWPNGAFALAIDGEVVAAADPLGASLEWRAGFEASAQ